MPNRWPVVCVRRGRAEDAGAELAHIGRGDEAVGLLNAACDTYVRHPGVR
jgi:hypothetical protein